MRFVSRLWNLFVGKRSGCERQSSTKGKTYSGASSVFEHPMSLRNLHRRWLPIVAVSILFSSCGVKTRPDAAPPYVETEFNSVEADFCGLHFFGVGGCSLPVGTSTKVSLVIQGFLTGEVSIFSDTCHTEFKTRYKDNEQIVVPLKILVGSDVLERRHSCTFRVVVAPDVLKNSEEKMWPRTGQFYLEVTQPTWISLPAAADQVRASEAPEPSRLFEIGTSGEFLLAGCGKVTQGSFPGPTLEIPGLSRTASCKYQLAIKASDGKKYSWIFLRNVYKANTEVIPASKITRKGKEICVDVSPEYTTFLAINSKWKNDSHLCSTEPGPWKVRVFTTRRNSYELVR